MMNRLISVDVSAFEMDSFCSYEFTKVDSGDCLLDQNYGGIKCAPLARELLIGVVGCQFLPWRQ